MKVLILEPSNFSPISTRLLEEKSYELVFGLDAMPLDLYKRVVILYARLSYILDKAFLTQFSSLEYIVSPATGTSHIDLEYLNDNNITLISLKGQTAFLKKITPTIEITVWLILSLLRKAHVSIYSTVHDLSPNGWTRDNYIGIDLYGATAGIIGLGRIGSHVATVLSSLGSNVIYYDPFVSNNTYQSVDLNTLLESSDVISINCIHNELTDNLLASNELSRLKPNSILVNTARGGIVNEDALYDHLLGNPGFKCGLDVLRYEHTKSNSALTSRRKLQNLALELPHQLILTPHIGGASYSAMRKTEDYCTQLLMHHLNNAP